MRTPFTVPRYTKKNKLVSAGPLKNVFYLVRHSKSFTNAGDKAAGLFPFFCTKLETDQTTQSDLNSEGIALAKIQAEKFIAEIIESGR